MADKIMELKTELERIDGQVWRAEQDFGALRGRLGYLLGWIERIRAGQCSCFCQPDDLVLEENEPWHVKPSFWFRLKSWFKRRLGKERGKARPPFPLKPSTGRTCRFVRYGHD